MEVLCSGALGFVILACTCWRLDFRQGIELLKACSTTDSSQMEPSHSDIHRRMCIETVQPLQLLILLCNDSYCNFKPRKTNSNAHPSLWPFYILVSSLLVPNAPLLPSPLGTTWEPCRFQSLSVKSDQHCHSLTEFSFFPSKEFSHCELVGAQTTIWIFLNIACLNGLPCITI